MEKCFELGKYYRHSSGKDLYICGLATPKVYGSGFVAEYPNGTYSIVGTNPKNASGWIEITKEEYLKNFKDDDLEEMKVEKNMSFGDINTSTNDGKYLLASMTILTTSEFLFNGEIVDGKKKTPDEIFDLLRITLSGMNLI